MSKSPTTPEFKVWLCEKYLSGDGSYWRLARQHKISKGTLQTWVQKYQEHGAEGFNPKSGNAKYSREFRIQCVQFVLTNQGTVNDAIAKFNISGRRLLQDWINKYNANMELKDYDPKREVYMAEARRKTTHRERKEIVDCCIGHNKDYKGTAALFDVSYSQVYS